MTSIKPDHGPGEAYDPDVLYAAYCEFKSDATRSLLACESHPEARAHITRLNRIISKQEFMDRLQELAQFPDRFEQFKKLLQDGWQNGRGQPLPTFLQSGRPLRR